MAATQRKAIDDRKKWSFGTEQAANESIAESKTPEVQFSGGVYRDTPPTYTDGMNAVLSFTSDGKLRTDAVIETGDIEIGAVELKNATTDDRAVINAANTARSTSTNVVCVQPIDSAGNVIAGDSTPTTLTGGSKTVTATGTAEALGTTLATKSIYIRAKSTNTGNVYVGDSNVDASTSKQIVLAAMDSLTIDISNRATVYIDVDVNGEGCDYLCQS